MTRYETDLAVSMVCFIFKFQAKDANKLVI